MPSVFCKFLEKCKKSKSFKSLGYFGGTLWLVCFLIPLWFCSWSFRGYYGIDWRTIVIWVPQTLIFAVTLSCAAVILIFLYLVADYLFRLKEGLPLFFTVFISLISGMGNALIIFMINETLRRETGIQTELLFFFLFGIAIYAGGSRIARDKLINITNHIVYKLRMRLVNKILNTPFESLEKLNDGIIQSTLNNDTEVVSTFANVIVYLITALTTVLFCFVYLGFINKFTLIMCIVAIIVIASIYFTAISSANKLLEEARTTQNTFFKFVNDMIKGFKELRLNIKKRKSFEEDINQLNDVYTKKRGKAFLSFADAFVVGELVFTLAIGFVVFIFPIIFLNLQVVDLRSYVFILLYLTGPINGILNSIPDLIQIRVSWNRISKLEKDISEISEKEVLIKEEYKEHSKINLELRNIEYEYCTENTEKFKIGPINYNFNSGEIIFITGGNGSGKSTLAKIITGLYSIQKGEVLLNGQAILTGNLEQKYSAIFGDYHLFDKLYGIDYESKKKEFQKYLNKLQIYDKIELKSGNFNTTKLSSGQRKRLALAISYLEDRPMYLFDEWAADQDPEFRDFFYNELLLELKQKGKCVIVITHDDRYFNMSDKLIKMELGKIVNDQKAEMT